MTICYNDLAGSLNLELWCGSNQLRNLDLSGLTQLEKLECCDNLLSSFDYSQLNPERLTYLNISDNNLPKQDLTIFIGSLKPLRNLRELKRLDISNTDIDAGLEYLSGSLEKVVCETKERPESTVQKLAEKLVIYNNEIKQWREEKQTAPQTESPPMLTSETSFSPSLVNLSLSILEQKITEFFQANQDLSKESNLLYSFYKVKSYTYNEPQKRHKLTVVAKDPNSRDQTNYQLERTGDLHLDLIEYENYPRESRHQIEELEIRGIKTKTIGWRLLTGKLDLSDFVNLQYLDCKDNQLTSLDLRKNTKLMQLNCSYNQLTSLDLANNLQLEVLYCSNNLLNNSIDSLLSKINPEKLNELDLANNNSLFKEFGLSSFRKFVNLKSLDLSNNIFCVGSLEPLQDLTKLEELNVTNTNINSGLEYLPDSLQKFQCYDPDYEKDSYDISNKNLEGPLRLKGFTKLEKLDCSHNKLTKLNLSDCPDLLELDISNNEFNDWEFLKVVPKLEILRASNNQKLSPQDLRIILTLKNLKELIINGCSSLQGSLKALENLSKLIKLNISNTNIKEGLEYLPKSCEIIYCNSDYQYKSTKIMEELDKSRCWDDKGRVDKADGLAASVIPSERLFVIRTTAVAGGVLAATVNPVLGGVLAAVSPVVEVDTSEFLDNYHELLGILEPIKIGERGEINKILEDLRKRVNEFLARYDQDSNGEIDIDELIEKRKMLEEDFNKDQENGKL
ncbi:27587_t:CDS:10 [Racocetra persica]|uniref:27587_t:CDS:1 n=1 Tax=Racocetra persica TaxID=160502 RepID=A0ACA9KPX8_9GLOM|nr:27587_t:CDS:10 [Racocetra persica]